MEEIKQEILRSYVVYDKDQTTDNAMRVINAVKAYVDRHDSKFLNTLTDDVI